ncbi:MAG: DMT family transporter [Leptolyngbya sp. SIO4C5]|nr:DMT family transporter [Leptolyngbya sp. SIO4C5]
MLGFLLVLLAASFFCFQNVIVRILFNQQNLFGLVAVGGFVEPTLQNSFLLLFMRTVVVVPLLATLMPKLYASAWPEIRQLATPQQRGLLGQAVAGGVFMFLYLALLYVAIGLIPTGIALTLFFTYPAFTALLDWRLFGARPSRFRWLIMALILGGSFLTLPITGTTLNQTSWLGATLGIASGLAYALYGVTAQKSFETVHPVPFTWLSFSITLGLSWLSLLFWREQFTSLAWTGLWIGGVLSAIFTLTGHLLNNFGIRLIGATRASMVGASNPALTVLLAWLAIQESLSGLQLIGVGVVTLSVALLSQEKAAPAD